MIILQSVGYVFFSLHLDILYGSAKLIGDLLCLEIAKDSFPSKEVIKTVHESYKMDFREGGSTRGGQIETVIKNVQFHNICLLEYSVSTN